MSVLLAAGADANIADNDGLTPLVAAAGMGSTGVVKALLDVGAEVEHKNIEGRTALFAACYHGRTDLGTGAAEGTVNHFLSVDLSNFQSVGILTSERFMNSLEEPIKTRIEVAIKRSEFASVTNFHKEFAEAQKVMMELEQTDIGNRSWSGSGTL